MNATTASTPTINIVTVTPELAAEYLERNYRNNRTVNRVRVEAYAADMKADKWTFTGEALKFAEDGTLIDGQHRLSAIVAADIPVDMLIIEGVEAGAVTNMDTNMPRSLRNVLEFLSYENPTSLARTLSSAAVYEAYMEDKISMDSDTIHAAIGSDSDTIRLGIENRDKSDKRPYQRYSNVLFTRSKALELLDRRPTLIDSVAAMKSHCHSRPSQKVTPPVGTVAMMHNIATTVGEGASVIEYVEAVRSGEGYATDIAWQVNRILERAGNTGRDQMLPYVKDALWFRGYEGYTGGNPGKIRTPKMQSYPTVPGDVEWYLAGREA